MKTTTAIAATGRTQQTGRALMSAAASVINTIFSRRVSATVAIAGTAAIWWHLLTVADTVAAQQAAGLDCLAMLPWGIAWTLRTISGTEDKEGGES